MENLLKLVGVLFLLTAVLHLYYPFAYGFQQPDLGIGIFGLIYLAMGILMLVNGNQHVRSIAVSLTILGLLGASYAYLNTDVHKPLDLTLIIIDVIIIPILIYSIIVRKRG